MGTWKLPYRITLECGCTVRARNSPLRPQIKYACRSNIGHGYSVRWSSWTDGTKTIINRTETL